jgi:anti-anti-sigma factor
MDSQNIQIVSSAGSRDGQMVLRLKGALSIHTIFDFQTAVRAETSPMLIVDFSDVPFIDSAGLGALVGVQLAAQRKNRKLVLTAMNPQVKALLDMTKVSEFFIAYPTIGDAQAATS